jgi:hypothetical protein
MLFVLTGEAGWAHAETERSRVARRNGACLCLESGRGLPHSKTLARNPKG